MDDFRGVKLYMFDDLFKVMTYPAGESHVRLRRNYSAGDSLVVAEARNFTDLCNIVTADRIYRHRFPQTAQINWLVPYFPFARHDRRVDGQDGYELGLALDLVKEIDITIIDPHSDVTGQLPHVTQAGVVNAWDKELDLFRDDPVIIIPDQGATKKAQTWIGGRDWLQGVKHRDMKTGNLSGFDVTVGGTLNGRACLIVDDICDGGGTFLGLASVLKKKGAGSLKLAVTHGLFTKGTDHLFNVFDEIYTVSNNFISEDTISYNQLFAHLRLEDIV